MKVKRVDEIVIKMTPGELESILDEIKNVIDHYDSSPGYPYPLALYDFAEDVREDVRLSE